MKKHPVDVLTEIESQKGAGSQKAKRLLIEDWFNDPSDPRPKGERELYKVVQYALNPWWNFYVQTIPGLNEIAQNARRESKEKKLGHRDVFAAKTKLPWKEQFATMFVLLDDLKSRKLSPNSSESHEAIRQWAKRVGSGTIETFRRIIHKDLRCGLQAASFNKIIPGWIPEFKCSLAKPFNEGKLQFPCFVDPKFDGERCLAFVMFDGSEGSVSYISRNGNEFQNFKNFSSDLLNLFRGVGCVVADCEVINKSGFQTLMKVPKYYDPSFDTSNLQLVVFDWIPLDDFNKQEHDQPQQKRYESLAKIFKNFISDKVIMVQTKLANSFQEAEQIFEYWIDKGLEGIIMKQPDAVYHFSTSSARNPGWIKMKGELSDEFKVVGIAMGNKNCKWEGKCGSLLIEKRGKSGESIIVGVASGLTDYHHNNLSEIDNQILYTQPNGEVINIKGKLVEVVYDQETSDGSLRFPRIKPTSSIIRTDK